MQIKLKINISETQLCSLNMGTYMHMQPSCSERVESDDTVSLSVSGWYDWQVAQPAIYSKGSFSSPVPLCDLQ